MIILRCKCGDKIMQTSMGGKDCQGCEDCKTTFAGHPDQHKELQPHKFDKKLFNQNTGKSYFTCSVCNEMDLESWKKSQKGDETV